MSASPNAPLAPSAPSATPDDPAAQARVGRTLDGKWTLESLLGLGGMGAVYLGRHRNGMRGAVKMLHVEVNADPEVRERFLREGLVANRIDHRGVVKVLDDDVVREGEDKGVAYLVMELLEGESVHARWKACGSAMPPHEVLAIAEGTLDVLVLAHAAGVVHRDLKPDNLFLVRERVSTPPDGSDPTLATRTRVKVLDFGIARIADARRTQVGAQLGTPAYMPPEQARGETSKVDGRSDLFALGATMFRLISGHRVHEAQGAMDLLSKMATLPARSLAVVAPEAPPSIVTIVDRALRFDRAERYPDARAMLDDVRAAREGKPLPHASSFAALAADRTSGGDVKAPAFDDVAPLAANVAQPSATIATAAAAPRAHAPTVVEAPSAAPLATVPMPSLGGQVVVGPTSPSLDTRGPTDPIAAAAVPIAVSPRTSRKPPVALLAALGVGAFVVLLTTLIIVTTRSSKPSEDATTPAESSEKSSDEKAAADDDDDDSLKPIPPALGNDDDDTTIASTTTASPTAAPKPAATKTAAPTAKPPTTSTTTAPHETIVVTTGAAKPPATTVKPPPPPPPPPPNNKKPPPGHDKDHGNGKH